MESEYGNDFELIQKYCIEKIIRRNSNVNHSLIGTLLKRVPNKETECSDEEILLQISLNLCKIDHSYLKNYGKLHNAASRIKDQFKESFRENDDHSD